MTTLIQMSPLWMLSFPICAALIIALIVRSKRALFVNIVSFAVLIFLVMGFKVPFSDIMNKGAAQKNRIRIMSCNLGNHVDAELLKEYIARAKPDIIAFQEVYQDNQEAINSALRGGWDLSFQGYLGIASRLKILNVENVNRDIVGGWGGLAARYDLEINGGVIQFFNIHTATSRDGIQAVIDEGFGGVPELQIVTKRQTVEFGILSRWVRGHKNILIAGDFNMPEADPVYRRSWSGFQNAFAKAGFGFGHTRFTRWYGVRIDHLLCDNSWKVIHSEVGQDVGSDHLPIIADLEFIGKRSGYIPQAEPAALPAADSSAFIYENFETSLGRLEKSQTAAMVIDAVNTYKHGNAVKIGPRAGSEQGSLGIQADNWRLNEYPLVSFAYMIPVGISFEIRVKTLFDDWLYLAGTDTSDFIIDGKWHDISIDARRIISKALPGVKLLQGLQFNFTGNAGTEGSFWIDEFKITKELK